MNDVRSWLHKAIRLVIAGPVRCFPAALLSVSIFCSSLIAQNESGGTIRGQVVEESQKRPLPFVNVLLERTSDSTLVTGTATDKNGKFVFLEVEVGEYFCRCSLIGYRAKLTVPILIDAQHRNADLGRLGLRETAVNLDEVLVTGQKASYLLRLESQLEPSTEEFEKEKSTFQTQVLLGKREAVVADWVLQLRQTAKVVVEPDSL